MRRRRLLFSLAILPLLAACAGGLDFGRQAGPEETMSGTLIVLRHTERSGEMLNAEGIARAKALPEALAGIEIDGIYAPGLQRNLDTAAPLAEAKGLEVQRIEATNIARTMFSRQPGGTLVWVGNRGNLSDLWEEIGAVGEPPNLYGQLFIVLMNGLKAGRVERTRFGD